MKIQTDKKVLVTGARGFLGSQIVKKLIEHGISKESIHACNSQCHNLLESGEISDAVKDADIVIHAAGNVGGIGYNQEKPASIFYENLKMGMELMEQSVRHKVSKFVYVGTVCSYPKFSPVPFREEDIWNGYPEETNAPYGLAKKILLVQEQAYREQYGFNGIYLIPVNLYGPGDHFESNKSHVIPATIKRIYEAQVVGKKEVTVWGTGNVSREFLYVEDAAEGIVLAAERYDKSGPINLGTGKEITIKDLTLEIARQLDYAGELKWDTSKPDGQPRRCLDTQKAKKEFGFEAKMPFEIGLKEEIKDYLRRYYNL